MHPKTAARLAALHALIAIEKGDQLLSVALNAQPVSSQLRGFAHEIGIGATRHQLHLDFTLALLIKKPLRKLDPAVRAALRLALYEHIFLSTPAPVIANEYAGLMREARLTSAVGFVNAVVRRLPDSLRPPPAAGSPAAHLSILYSHPRWLVQRWLDRFAFDDCAALCKANNQIAPLSLRVNTLRASRGAVLESLRARGLDAVAGEISPEAILVRNAGSPLEWPEWIDGSIIAQDEAAQLVARLAAPLPGQTVIDAAAAPGGKTTHLAQLMGDRGCVQACDIAVGRLKLVSDNARRLGLGSIRLCPGDFAEQAFEPGSADLVLLDAPCLGTGTLRRRPDAKWRKAPGDLGNLVTLQRRLLDAAARVLRPGGVLVYSTCSLEPEENELQIEGWLAANPQWQIEAPTTLVTPQVTTPAGYLQTLPHRDGCDGMFAARLKKGSGERAHG